MPSIDDLSSPCSDLGRFIISSLVFFPLLLSVFLTSYLLFLIYHPHIFIDFEYNVSFYILIIFPISPPITLFVSHHYHSCFHWMFLCPLLMRLLMQVTFHTRGHGVDHWVFEPSFPSFFFCLINLSLHYGSCRKTTLRP